MIDPGAGSGVQKCYFKSWRTGRKKATFSRPSSPPTTANRQVFFHLGWASADYEVRVNGKAVAYDSDCSAPAEFNLTRHAQEGRNTLEIVVSAPSQVARLESWNSDPAPAIGPAWVYYKSAR